jgi:hypothetical protein
MNKQPDILEPQPPSIPPKEGSLPPSPLQPLLQKKAAEQIKIPTYRALPHTRRGVVTDFFREKVFNLPKEPSPQSGGLRGALPFYSFETTENGFDFEFLGAINDPSPLCEKAEALAAVQKYIKTQNDAWQEYWGADPRYQPVKEGFLPLFDEFLELQDCYAVYHPNFEGHILYWQVNYRVMLPSVRIDKKTYRAAVQGEYVRIGIYNDRAARTMQFRHFAVEEIGREAYFFAPKEAVQTTQDVINPLAKTAKKTAVLSAAPSSNVATDNLLLQTHEALFYRLNGDCYAAFAATPQGGVPASVSGVRDYEENTSNEETDSTQSRYILKVLHRMRNCSNRLIDVSMSSYVYSAYRFKLMGKEMKSIVMQVKQNGSRNINPSIIKNIDSSNPLHLGKEIKQGLIIDDKLYFFFDNEQDRGLVVSYLKGDSVDNFIPTFKFFNETTMDMEISNRQVMPNLINQSTTSLCGYACFSHVIAEHYKEEYKNLVKDLFFYGEAFYGKSKYLIKPHSTIFADIYDINPNDIDNYPTQSKKSKFPNLYPPLPMAQADYILLSSLRNSENAFFSYDGVDDGELVDGSSSMTLPSEIVKLLHRMTSISLKNIKDNTTFNPFADTFKLFEEMQSDFNDGNICFMLINMNFIYQAKTSLNTSLYPEHWIIYQGNESTNASGNYVFDVFTWGELKRTIQISKENIQKHFFGSINFLI